MDLKKSTSLVLILAVGGAFFSGCSKDDVDGPKKESMDIAENIVGNWLLASSTVDEWATYEFTNSSRINAITFENAVLQSGSGYYWIDEDKASVTGNIEYGDSRLPVYFDWVVDKVYPFELAIELYDNNKFIGNTALYRIVAETAVEVEATAEINFKAICGTESVSNFRVLDSSVAEVTSTGEISGLKNGETYLIFKTPGGYAAMKIEVLPAPKTFAELAVGTWIYDNPYEREWQATTFEADGFIDVKWANPYSYNTIETAVGYYSISDNVCLFSVTTPYGLTLNQKWQTEEINDFIWSYQAFSDNQTVGKYTGHRLLGSVTLRPGEKTVPDYKSLTFGYDIVGYTSNSVLIAGVNEKTGEITAFDYGRTYINVTTAQGSGYFEVNVEKPAIPYDFPVFLGADIAEVIEVMGADPDYSTASMIAFFNPTTAVDMISVTFDISSGLSKAVVVSYNSKVVTDAVTAELDRKYIPLVSQTTDSFKAYMDTDKREDAKFGVTWDIPKLTLTYVNLAN